MEIMDRIESTEEEYNSLGQQAEDAPHRWGHEQQEQSERLAAKLQKLYDEAGIDELDRIAL